MHSQSSALPIERAVETRRLLQTLPQTGTGAAETMSHPGATATEEVRPHLHFLSRQPL